MSGNKYSIKWWKRLKSPHRFVIRNEKTLDELVSFKINLTSAYLIMSSFVVIILLLAWLLNAYTPLKRLMPGYDDVYTHPEYIALSEQIYELEASFNELEFYTESFKRLLTGEASDTANILTSTQESPIEFQGKKPEILNEIQTVATKTPDSPEHITSEFIPLKKGQEESRSSILKQLYLIPPIKGVITNGFDPVKNHYGIDLAAPKNTPVKAILDGYVISSDWTLETGNTICIQHENNIISFYKHNAVNLRKVGNYVKSGEAVAIIGNTGESTSGPHLHFELWVRGAPVNPVEYIQF